MRKEPVIGIALGALIVWAIFSWLLHVPAEGARTPENWRYFESEKTLAVIDGSAILALENAKSEIRVTLTGGAVIHLNYITTPEHRKDGDPLIDDKRRDQDWYHLVLLLYRKTAKAGN